MPSIAPQPPGPVSSRRRFALWTVVVALVVTHQCSDAGGFHRRRSGLQGWRVGSLSSPFGFLTRHAPATLRIAWHYQRGNNFGRLQPRQGREGRRGGEGGRARTERRPRRRPVRFAEGYA